jgi:hypothetical protein
VVINEVMAANDSCVQDPQGDYDDWVELYNPGDRTVDLSGMHLTDDATHLDKWTFPEGTTLDAGAYLVVWADEDGGDDPGLHASFKLSASGEQVYLVDTEAQGNAVLDSVVFGQQEADRAYGRIPDGTGSFTGIALPTLAGANLAATAVTDQTAGALPTRFALEQNFPNPFNSGTVIRFSLPGTAADRQLAVELAIFNLVGQQVASLGAGEYLPGTYEVRWDGRDQSGRELGSGLYFCRLRAGGQVETRRMVLLR